MEKLYFLGKSGFSRSCSMFSSGSFNTWWNKTNRQIKMVTNHARKWSSRRIISRIRIILSIDFYNKIFQLYLFIRFSYLKMTRAKQCLRIHRNVVHCTWSLSPFDLNLFEQELRFDDLNYENLGGNQFFSQILCWGVRNMKTFMLSDIDCPQVVFEVGGQQIESTIIKNAKKTPNFDKPLLFLDVLLPKEDLYTPPMNIKVRDHRSFGRKPIVGYHIIKSLETFRCDPKKPSLTLMQTSSISHVSSEIFCLFLIFRNAHWWSFENECCHGSAKEETSEKGKFFCNKRYSSYFPQKFHLSKSQNQSSIDTKPTEDEIKLVDKKTMKKRIKTFLKKHQLSHSPMKTESKLSQIQKLILKSHQSYQGLLSNEVRLSHFTSPYSLLICQTIPEDDIDWWSKYYASKGQSDKCGTYLDKHYETLTVN